MRLFRSSTSTLARDQSALDSARYQLHEALARFEGVVSAPFFAGERFGMVDAAVAPIAYRLKILEENSLQRFFEGLPKTAAWASAMAARPSVVQGVSPDFERLFIASFRRSDSAVWQKLLRREQAASALH